MDFSISRPSLSERPHSWLRSEVDDRKPIENCWIHRTQKDSVDPLASRCQCDHSNTVDYINGHCLDGIV